MDYRLGVRKTLPLRVTGLARLLRPAAQQLGKRAKGNGNLSIRECERGSPLEHGSDGELGDSRLTPDYLIDSASANGLDQR